MPTQQVQVAPFLDVPEAQLPIVTGTGQTTNVNSPANFSYWNNIGYVPFGNDTGGSGR